VKFLENMIGGCAVPDAGSAQLLQAAGCESILDPNDLRLSSNPNPGVIFPSKPGLPLSERELAEVKYEVDHARRRVRTVEAKERSSSPPAAEPRAFRAYFNFLCFIFIFFFAATSDSTISLSTRKIFARRKGDTWTESVYF
jgi:hypothetical protein